MKSKELLSACNTIALNLLFTKNTHTSLQEKMEELNIEFRKNKTVEDVIKAVRKGLKQGMGRVEHEISMSELYLADVFKMKK
jgi:lipoate-protein ligase A